MDTSAIAFSGLAEFAEPLLGLVNELAREASFPEGEFERERRQMLEAVRVERTTPGFLASERLRKVLFGAHPYAQVSPSEAQVAAYRLQELGEVYRSHYRPGNALLLLLGDFRAEEMRAQIEKTFGGWKGEKPAAKAAAEPPAVRGRRSAPSCCVSR